MAAPDLAKDFYTEALIIGGSMGRVYGLHRLRQEGFQVKLVKAGSYFGGVWHWNRHPGARVDSECPLYQLNIPEVCKHWNWTERFPGSSELRKYYQYCDEVLKLSKDCIFNTIVDCVTWKDGIWTCTTRDERAITCKYLLLCTGSSYKKHYPDFRGLDRFKGMLVHSAMCPDEGIDVRGKKVRLVGNDLTRNWEEDCELTTFIRTPNVALPMMQRQMTVAEQENQKIQRVDELWKDLSHEQLMARIEESWQQGGFAVLISTFEKFLTDKEVNAVYYDFWKNKVRARISDRSKAEIVAPEKQEHFFGVKRSNLEQDYYETLDRPNVKLVNLKKTPIQEFTERGIVADDKLHEFDIIILATGYDSMTGSLTDLNIRDRHGTPLQEKWRQDIQDMNNKTLHPMENSWYMGANTPGKVREQLVYLGGLNMYNKQIAATLDGWNGFDVTKAKTEAES